jgi:gliding motility-associated-like protein
MHRILQLLTIFVCLLCAQQTAWASHLLGGEIGYKYISSAGTQHTYEVTLKLYSDCSSTSAALPQLIGANPQVNLYNNTSLVQGLNLTYQASESDIEITPVCPDEANNTACVNINNPIPGIKAYVYRGNFILNGTSTNWIFAFEGYINAGSSAGRTPIIQNANVLNGSSLMYLKATLNNAAGLNSNCTFTSAPTPFFCINKDQTYNLAAVDPDGDSLHFSLVDAQQVAVVNTPPPNNITYLNPYTAIAPLPTAVGDFSFNANNGQMNFTPNAVLNCVVVNQVSEYRNGILIGTSMREMTFIIINNCNNNNPLDTVSNAANSDIIIENGLSLVATCEGQTGVVAFDVLASDPDNDNIDVTWSNLPAGAVGTVLNNNSPNPTFHLDWSLGVNTPPGDYTYYLTFTDDGCPLSSTKTVSKTIRILPFVGGLIPGSQSPCKNQNDGFAFLNQTASDLNTYTIIWKDNNGDTLRVHTSNQGDTLKNLVPGAYTATVYNDNGCSKSFTIGVLEGYYGATYTVPDTVGCVNSNFSFTNTSYGNLGNYRWNFGDGSPIANTTDANHAYNISGVYTVTLYGTNPIGCVDSFSKQIYVDSVNHPYFTINQDSVCMGQTIIFAPHLGNYATAATWNFGGFETLYANPTDTIHRGFDQAGIYNVSVEVDYRACDKASYNRDIHIYNFPLVNLGDEKSLCLNGDAIELQNLATNTTPGTYRYLWNTGATTPSIKVVKPGTYSLTLSNAFDCTTTETVTISKDCYTDIPNAFSPNGDGENDYFFPRQYLSKGVRSFSMIIFNRYGQKIFETRSIDGRGWDGNFNDKPQPSGVYVYQIDLILNNGAVEKHTGNVTLLR